MPFTCPVTLSIGAIDELLLYHTPLLAVLVSVVESPKHTEVAPEIAPTVGNGFTVIGNVAVAEPHVGVVTTYSTLVVPPPAPVTTPVVLMCATAPETTPQVPPLTDSDIVMVVPSQNGIVPEETDITPASGNGLTVITKVSEADPQVGVVTV